MKEYTQKLAVFFLTTKKEAEAGDLLRAINYYLYNIQSKNSFDLFLCFDQKVEKKVYDALSDVKKHQNINDVIFHCNNIPDDLNIYLQPWKKKTHSLPFDLRKLPMGRSHGINKHFYDTLFYLQKLDGYENYMLLESDTKPMRSDWFDSCLKYAENTEYLVAGSVYKGKDREEVSKKYYSGHLNGVGLYKKSEKAHNFIKESKEYLKELLLNDYNSRFKMYWAFMNYDVAMYLLANKGPYFKKEYATLYKDTDIFTNCSTTEDEDLSLNSVLNEFPETIILHKKKMYDSDDFNITL